MQIRNIRKLRHFLENSLNSINHSLTLLLSVLTQYFIVGHYKKLRKGKYRYAFVVLYVYIVLGMKLINLFGKKIVANGISKIKRNKNC